MTTLVLLSDLVFKSNHKLDQRILSLFNSEQPSIGYSFVLRSGAEIF
ncbi:hypothetical protein J7E78_15155 [Paenibacillus polymyxa]|nr:hypothetical protein [Paenibacillus polymyxa]MBT2284880.1 hypothetical protein [Paenibacillus polymyxa]